MKKVLFAIISLAVFAGGAVLLNAKTELVDRGFEFLISEPKAIDNQRVGARFNHDVHTKALEGKGCKDCHDGDSYDFVSETELSDESLYIDTVHRKCLSCHEDAVGKTGPVTCGECHDRNFAANVKPMPAVMDHAKHSEIQCVECHTGYPKVEKIEVTKELGHKQCMDCHYKDAEIEKVSCSSCHKPVVKTTNESTKMMAAVKFNHDGHEKRASCQTCHKRTPSASNKSFGEAELLAVTGDYHDKSSKTSCVGCHAVKRKGPQYNQCKDCHVGEKKPKAVMVKTVNKPEASYVLDALAVEMSPVKYNHKKHEDLVGDCSTCHHYSKNEVISSCSACHKKSDYAYHQRRDLTSAYHGQCLGCHQKMGVGPVGCAECHEEKK